LGGVIGATIGIYTILPGCLYRFHDGNDILQSDPFIPESNDCTMTTTNRTAISVFISYAHKDEALLKQLHTHLSSLTRQGLIVTWYDRQIVAGSDWAGVIDDRLEQASIILLLVSADFIASKYCYEVEMKRALERHEAGQARVIPIALRPADWKDMPFASLQALPTDARPVTTWPNQDAAFVDVVAGIRRAIEDLSQLPASTARAALPKLWNIPYARNSFFLGRDALLARLHAQLQAGQTTALSQSPQAISGLGGIGKTQLAIEYAYRYAHNYEAVLWARAETREDLIASYSALATLLKLPERMAGDQEKMLVAVKAWLQQNGGWLLILDNADELDLLPPLLPPLPGGHILLTTRAYDMQGFASRLTVETLSAQKVYQTHRRMLLQERRSLVEDHPEAVATTWLLSFKRVEARSPAAADLLRLCAHLAPDAIPETIVTEGAEHLGDQLAPVAADAFLFAQAIEALRAYSLLSRDPRSRTLTVHRLVQAVTQDSLPAQDAQQWKQRAVLAVCAARPDVTDVKRWTACERWLPHALLCATWIEHEQISRPEAALLLNAAGYYLKQRGRYREAEPLYRRAISIVERLLGDDHPNTRTVRRNYADLLRAMSVKRR
jgi:tetratricopeptide (TPR) repeat protein